MSDREHEYQDDVIVNLADDSIVSHSQSVQITVHEFQVSGARGFSASRSIAASARSRTAAGDLASRFSARAVTWRRNNYDVDLFGRWPAL